MFHGKLICNVSFNCEVEECAHKVPHTRIESDLPSFEGCDAQCHCGTCEPIEEFEGIANKVYAVKKPDGDYHRVDINPISDIVIPEFNMDEKIYICQSHDTCSESVCGHKQFHNRSVTCGMECHVDVNCVHTTCREANNEEILQLFKDHVGENQHIDDMLQRDDNAYLDFMEEVTKPKPKPKPEKPKIPHERVMRFLNLEL